MRKFIVMLICSSILLSGCSIFDEEIVTTIDEPVTITFWHGMSGTNEEVLDEIIEEYNQSQQYVTVVAEGKGDYYSLDNAIESAVDTNALPTIAQAYPTAMYKYNRLGIVRSLNPFNEQNAFGFDIDKFITSYVDEDVSIDGELLGVPFNKSTELLYINKELLNKYEIDIPTNYNELVESVVEYNEATGKAAIGFNSYSNLFATILANIGYTDWQNNDQFVFTEDDVIDAFATLQNGVKKGYIDPNKTNNYMTDKFASGDIAMLVGSSAGAPIIEQTVDDNFTVEITEYPVQNVIQQGTSITLFNTATDLEQAAAIDFLSFLTSDDNMYKWATNTGYLPATKSTLESDKYQDYLETDSAALQAYEQVDHIKQIVPVFLGSDTIYNEYVPEAMNSILIDEENVEDVLTDLSQRSSELYNSY